MFTGCLPPQVDIRDYRIKKEVVMTAHLPESFELANMPNIKDQQQVCSCVAHAMSTILEYHDKNKTRLSTNYLYGGQKFVCGREDKGMYLRDACKIANIHGDATEEYCPGNDEVPECCEKVQWLFDNQTMIHDEDSIYKYHIESYTDLQSEQDIKYAIMNYGPVLASVKWYDDSFVSDGILYSNTDKDYGYHAVVLYGWTPIGFLFQNSWGEDWGNGGRAIVPYSHKIREAKCIVDYDNSKDDIVKPIRSPIRDVFYKVYNFIINIFKRK